MAKGKPTKKTTSRRGPAATAKTTKGEVARIQELREKRLKLQRQIDAIEREEKQIANKIKGELLAASISEKLMHGCRFQLVAKRYVKWKDAFIKECGSERATELQENQPPSYSLKY